MKEMSTVKNGDKPRKPRNVSAVVFASIFALFFVLGIVYLLLKGTTYVTVKNNTGETLIVSLSSPYGKDTVSIESGKTHQFTYKVRAGFDPTHLELYVDSGSMGEPLFIELYGYHDPNIFGWISVEIVPNEETGEAKAGKITKFPP